MADRIVDNADLILDETKRKARRRLVGAIVLALAAAIILPMLLEKEPRPLGDDVSVKIPPMDESKFINKLTGKSGDTKPLPKAEESKTVGAKSEPKSEPKPGTAAAAPSPNGAPIASAPIASAPIASAPGAAAVNDAAAPAKAAAGIESRPSAPEPTPAAKSAGSSAADTKSDAKPAVAESKAAAESRTSEMDSKSAAVDSKPASADSKAGVADAKPAIASLSPPPPASSAAPAATPAKAEGFVVQLAAFADDKGANSLSNKLKKAGYSAFVEPVHTSRGMLWRVRVGGYGTRSEADAARSKLKGEGFSGIVAPAS